jgi:hypothetical protein
MGRGKEGQAKLIPVRASQRAPHLDGFIARPLSPTKSVVRADDAFVAREIYRATLLVVLVFLYGVLPLGAPRLHLVGSAFTKTGA